MLGFGAVGEFAIGEIGSDAISLSSEILKEVVTHFVNAGTLPSLPNRLHHFTSLETACRIVEGDNVRLSHAEYSNDQTEMAQAKVVIRGELASRSTNSFFSQVSVEYERVAPTLDAYIYCMCMDGQGGGAPQDILSQWRAYGQDGRGACLTLSTGDLIRLVSNVPGLRINPVMYSNAVQVAFIVDILNRGQMLHSAGAANALEATIAALVFATPLMKAQGFEEEREWRLIFIPPQDGPQPMLHFQARRDFIAPYLDLDHLWGVLVPQMHANRVLRAMLPTILPAVGPLLVPIAEIMVGPSGHQGLNVRAIKKLLAQKSLLSVVVDSSGIPYRSLN